jgi:hypothetical protein
MPPGAERCDTCEDARCPASASGGPTATTPDATAAGSGGGSGAASGEDTSPPEAGGPPDAGSTVDTGSPVDAAACVTQTDAGLRANLSCSKMACDKRPSIPCGFTPTNVDVVVDVVAVHFNVHDRSTTTSRSALARS